VGRKALVWIVGLAILAAGCARASARPAARPALVAIAASDAVGLGATNPDRDNWVAQLGVRLSPGTRVVNLGISGATGAQAAAQELPVALDAAPSLAVVWLGVNDMQQRVPLETFSANLTQILGELRQKTGARVYVANVPDLTALGDFSGWDPAALQAAVVQWNAEIARITAEQGAHLVDIHAAWSRLRERDGLISGDGLHPTSAGYQRIAELFLQAIQAG
jgi:lysophospholipase L1-like esterase